jgi:hypothetical protein
MTDFEKTNREIILLAAIDQFHVGQAGNYGGVTDQADSDISRRGSEAVDSLGLNRG